MGDIITCEDCGLRHDRLYVCDVKERQAWARKTTALESERDLLNTELETERRNLNRYRDSLDATVRERDLLKVELENAENRVSICKDLGHHNHINKIENENNLLQAKLAVAREALEWFVEEYERGERKGYERD